jgi:hypothetical protein
MSSNTSGVVSNEIDLIPAGVSTQSPVESLDGTALHARFLTRRSIDARRVFDL